MTIFCILFFSIGSVFSQNLVVNPATDLPAEVIACGDTSEFSFRLYGPFPANTEVSVRLPSEAEFTSLVPGGGVSVDATDPNNPIFNFPTRRFFFFSFVDVTYYVQTGCTVMSNPEIVHEMVADPSVNNTVSYPTVLYSALEVNNTIVPASATLNINNTQDFTFNIGNDPVSPQAYSNNVVSHITHSTNIALTYSGTGTLTLGTPSGGMVTDILTLGAAEISTIGDNDTRFEQNESIDITITAQLLGCPSGAGENISYQAAYGGCLSTSNTCETGNSSTSGIAMASGAPDLHTEVIKKAWPGLTTTDTAEFLLRNDGTGSGDIYNLTLDLGFSNGGAVYIPVDIPIYTWSNFNVSGTTFSNSGANGSLADFQLTTDPDGPGVGIEDLDGDGFFDDLPVGNSLVLEAELAYDYLLDTNNDTACDAMYNGYAIVRWAYEFQDSCGDTISLNVPNASLNTWRPWSFYNTQSIASITNSSSGSTNFGPGDTFDFYISTSSGQTPTDLNIPGLHWEVHYTLPAGIVPNGNGLWQNEPFNLISFDNVTGIAIYTSNAAPTYGHLVTRNPSIPLMVDPACASSYVGSISYEYHLKGDSTYEPIHICKEGPTFAVSCPSAGPSVCISNFSFDRTTLGYTDMSETTPITNGTPGIRLDHALEGDMVRWHVEVDINESNLTTANALLEYDSTNWFSTQYDGGIKAIQIEYVPAGGGASTFSSDLSQYSYTQNNGGKSNHSVNLLGGSLSGITPAIGDRYIIDVDLKVSERSSFSSTLYEPLSGLLASSPVTSTGNPILHTCNYITEEFGVLDYRHVPNPQASHQSYSIDGCNEINMGFRFLFSRYSLIGDLFPNEFRNFAVPKVLEVLVPSGVDYVPNSASLRTYGEANMAILDPIITYNEEPGFHKYSWTNPGTWNKEKASVSYDYLGINFKVIPNCNIEDWSYSDDRLGITVLPTTEYEIYRNISLPGRTINLARAARPRSTQYTPLTYSISSTTPTISTNTNTAAWDLNINNTTSGGSDLQNTWIAIEIPNDNIVPTLWDGVTQIPLIGYGTGKYWAQVGDIDSSGKALEIRSDNFTVCGSDTFNIRVGQNCGQYPTDPDTGYSNGGSGTNYICNEETTVLSLNTQDPSINLATTLGTPPATYDFCDIVPYEIYVNNGANGFAYALGAVIELPVGMNLDDNSGILNYDSVDYPLNSSQITHEASTNTYTVDISATAGSAMSGANGLPGVSNLNPNEFRLNFDMDFTCDYVSGSKITTQLTGESACQQAIDPNQGQSELETNPVNVTQVPSNIDYAIDVTSDDNTLFACGQTEAIAISITNQGITSDSSIEKIVATIDDAFDYVSGSFVAGTNGPSGPPTVTVNGVSGERELTWTMPDGIPSAATIEFDFEIEVVDPLNASCQDYDLTLSTRIEQTIDCSGTGGLTCPSLNSITSQETELINVEKSDVVISSTTTTSTINGSNEDITANFSFENTTAIPLPTGTEVSAYFDANSDGVYDAGDILIGTETLGAVAANSTINDAVNFTTSPTRVCNIILVARLQDNPCICSPNEDVMVLPSQIDGVAGANRTICENATSNLGITNNSNFSYSWAGSNTQETSYLSASDVAMPTFSYSGTTLTANTSFTYTLTVTRPNGCASSDEVTININSAPIATISSEDASCSINNGSITFSFNDNPGRTGIEFSLNGGATYEPHVADNSGSVTYSNLAAGTYNTWVRWGNNQCPIELGNQVIGTIPVATISAQPTNQNVFVGDNTTFSVSTQNADTYQWQVSTDGTNYSSISDGGQYSGTQTNTLTVNSVDKTIHGNLYRAQVSNSGTSCSTLTSNSAELLINVRTVITNRRITPRVRKN